MSSKNPWLLLMMVLMSLCLVMTACSKKEEAAQQSPATQTQPPAAETSAPATTPAAQPAAASEQTQPAATPTPADAKTTQPAPATQETTSQPAPTTAEVKMVPLDIKLPKPMFIGTPSNLQVPNLEKPLGKARPAFLAPEGTTNVALRKSVKSSDDAPVIGEITMVTDGDNEAGDGSYVELGPFLQNVTIDLGKKHNIYAILVWHYHKQPRVYFDVIVQAADDPNFTSNVVTVFNNDHDNTQKMGAGTDLNYVETSEGKLIDAKGVQGRYVRLYSNGNNNDDLNHYIEVAVYGKPVGAI
ncbi:MAG: hypothetical protein ALAOOOJD_04389 [bacterium]|nr:hypothetical protein [bacterium]